ncbi:MAG: GNAT family N-acetyltransferase [Burkholderiales bacterium]|nr:GNAT family N-acetyltransferase [Burkholderiales bacterium]
MTDVPMESGGVAIVRVDYADPAHGDMLLAMLDAYACDPAGGGEPLSPPARDALLPGLAARPHAFSLLALRGGEPVGLVNCFEGFSTFAARPLVNVHDLVVASGHRGQRIGERLLAAVEEEARARGACKVTLEVLTGNMPAQRLYARTGFAGYELDPAMGQARLLQKWLDA